MSDKNEAVRAEGPFLKFVNSMLLFVDDVILVLVATGIVGVACLLLIESLTDFIYYSDHSIPHIISDLMFILIIMELFRQVMRQLKRHVFTLNPFIFIGVIASIRGLLLTQMEMAMGEAEVESGLWKMGIHALIVVVLMASLLIYSKTSPIDK